MIHRWKSSPKTQACTCVLYGLVVALSLCLSAGAADGVEIRTDAVAVLPAGGYTPDTAKLAAAIVDAKGKDMVAELERRLGGRPDAMVFFCQEQGQIRRLVSEIRAAAPGVPLVGCRTSRSFFFDKDRAILSACTLVGLKGDGVQIKTASAAYSDEKSMVAAGAELARKLKPADGRGVLLLLTDARISHGWEAVPMYEAMQEQLGRQVVLIGGNATYGERSLLIHNDKVSLKQHVGLMISGPVVYKMLQDPAKPAITKPLKITKAVNGNEIVQLDGRPWQAVYREALAPHEPAELLNEALGEQQNRKAWAAKISKRYPFAVLMEGNQPLVRYAPGLRGDAESGYRLYVHSLVEQDLGDRIVILRPEADQIGKHIGPALSRLGKDMPDGSNLTVFCPCESELRLTEAKHHKTFIDGMRKQAASHGPVFGFFPCGEHGAWFDPARDKQVHRARYHQLSYPMARVVAAPAAAEALKGDPHNIYVDASAEAGDGSATRPFPTLTEALAAWKATAKPDPKERMTIHVAAGTYKPKAVGGKEDIPAAGWSITRPIRVIGSYRRAGGEWKLKPHDGAVELGYPETVIDLAKRGRAFHVDAPRVKHGKKAAPVRLQGLSIRNGRSDDDGGAVLSKGNAPLEILDCDFVGNRAAWRGGAVCADPANRSTVAYIYNCVFKSNAATGDDGWGGGLYSEAETFVKKCRFYDNRAAHGAACGGEDSSGWWVAFALMYANEGDFALHLRPRRMDDGQLRNSRALSWAVDDGVSGRSYTRKHIWGAGMHLRLVRSTIADNDAGGIRLVDPVDATQTPRPGRDMEELLIRGVIVAGNRGVGISYDPSGSEARAIIQVNNSWGNAGGNWGGAASITGNNKSADPLFRDGGNPDLDKRDYSLRPGSPSIAWADYRGPWMAEGHGERSTGDLAGNDAFPGARGDMGAYVHVPREGEPKVNRDKPGGLTVHTFYVDRDWPGPYKGTAAAPFQSITAAVNAVDSFRGPHEIYNIRIADGLYDRSVEGFGGFGIDLSYQIVNLFGGYQGWNPESGTRSTGSGQAGEGAKFDWSEKARKPRSTIVDPQGKSRAFVTNQEAMTQHRLDGLTIRNGWVVGHGGAVCVQGLGGEAAMVAFNDCLFENNECTGEGGAVAVTTGDFPAYLTHCDFVNNRAGGSGGAVYWLTWEASLPLPLLNCRFTGNRAAGDGGAVFFGSNETGIVLEDCVLERNLAAGVGGAICQRPRSPENNLIPMILRRCRLVNNDATGGGAVYVDRNLLTVLQGCVVAGNGGDYAVYCRSLPAGRSDRHRKRNPTWRRVNPRWEGWRIQRLKLPAVYAEFCTFADNSGGGIYYKDHNPEPVNNDTAGVGVTDSIFTGNGGVPVADASGNHTARGTVTWSLFHRNATDVGRRRRRGAEGTVALGTGVVRADPLLDGEYRPRSGSPAMTTDKVRSYTDVNGDTVSLHPGYAMGATGFTRDRADRQGDWQRAEHDFHVDASAKEDGDGSAAAPFRTLAEAVAAINRMERTHRWADTYVVRVADGTYDAGADEKIKPARPEPAERTDFAVDAKAPPAGLGEGLVIEKGRVSFVGSYAGDGNWRKRGPSAALRAGKRTSVIDPGRHSRAMAAAASYDVALSFDGFVFRNGGSLHGGGAIRMYGGISFLGGVGRAELALNDCTFENNRSWFAGGAVNIGGNCLSFTAEDCDFRNNEAGQGGALFLPNPPYCDGLAKDVKISSCDFDRNRAAQAGGALWTNNRPGSVPLIEQTTFRFNAAAVADRPRGWTLPLRDGGAVFMVFCPHLPADGNNAQIIDWPFGWQMSFGGKRTMQKTDIMTFRECRFYGNKGRAGNVIQSEPAFNQAERVFSWMPSWLFRDCRVDKSNWDGFHSRAHRRPGTEPFDPDIEAELTGHLRSADTPLATRRALDGLVRVSNPKTLALAADFLDDKQAQQAAAEAVIRIARGCDLITASEDTRKHARSVISKAAGLVKNEKLRKAAEALLVTLDRKPAEATRAAKPPTVDGKLDDAIWDEAKPVDDFRVAGSAAPAAVATVVRWAYDGEHLYLAIRCEEPQMAKLAASAKQRDSARIWRDDHVQVLLDADFDRRTALQILVNPAGTVLDREDQDAAWNGSYTVATRREQKAWVLEMAIPWKTLECKAPTPGTAMGINICRRRVGSKKEPSGWIDTGGGNLDPRHFGILKYQ